MSQFPNHNPYQTPVYQSPPMPQQAKQLSSRLKRFLGSIVDSLAGFLFLIPGLIVTIIGGVMADSNSETGVFILFAGLAFVLLGMLAYAVVQIYLLAVSSQSIGKYLLKMQIYDITTNQRSNFVQCFLLRSCVGVYLLGHVPFYSLVDALFIFRDDYRCVHDLIANSVVVDIDS